MSILNIQEQENCLGNHVKEPITVIREKEIPQKYLFNHGKKKKGTEFISKLAFCNSTLYSDSPKNPTVLEHSKTEIIAPIKKTLPQGTMTTVWVMSKKSNKHPSNKPSNSKRKLTKARKKKVTWRPKHQRETRASQRRQHKTQLHERWVLSSTTPLIVIYRFRFVRTAFIRNILYLFRLVLAAITRQYFVIYFLIYFWLVTTAFARNFFFFFFIFFGRRI